MGTIAFNNGVEMPQLGFGVFQVQVKYAEIKTRTVKRDILVSQSLLYYVGIYCSSSAVGSTPNHFL